MQQNCHRVWNHGGKNLRATACMEAMMPQVLLIVRVTRQILIKLSQCEPSQLIWTTLNHNEYRVQTKTISSGANTRDIATISKYYLKMAKLQLCKKRRG